MEKSQKEGEGMEWVSSILAIPAPSSAPYKHGWLDWRKIFHIRQPTGRSYVVSYWRKIGVISSSR